MSDIPCRVCHGEGYIRLGYVGGADIEEPCGECSARGRAPGECTICGESSGLTADEVWDPEDYRCAVCWELDEG